MSVCLSVCLSVRPSVTPAVSGVRGADEQQKTKFVPSYSVRLQYNIRRTSYQPGNHIINPFSIQPSSTIRDESGFRGTCCSCGCFCCLFHRKVLSNICSCSIGRIWAWRQSDNKDPPWGKSLICEQLKTESSDILIRVGSFADTIIGIVLLIDEFSWNSAPLNNGLIVFEKSGFELHCISLVYTSIYFRPEIIRSRVVWQTPRYLM